MTSHSPKGQLPFLFSSALYLALSAFFLWSALKDTHGSQIFITDDAYIHASLAKNLVLHGVLSISPPEFSSCASSIIWPILLALCFSILGIHLWVILGLNAVFALSCLWVADKLIVELAGSNFQWARTVTLFMTVICGSLVVQTFVGLEHNLQILTMLLLMRAAARVLSGDVAGEKALCAFGVLAVLCRYEAVFGVILIFLFLCWRRRFRVALVLAVVSALPVVLASAYGLSKGALLLPNSLLLKSRVANHWRIFPSINWTTDYPSFILVSGGALLLLCLLAVLLVVFAKSTFVVAPKLKVFLYLITALMCAHYQFAKTGWILSYEAYLVVLALVTCASLIISLGVRQMSASEGKNLVLVFMTMITILLTARIYQSDFALRKGFVQIYQQQFQMARFLAQYYPNATVAINDIGLISYYRSGKILDVYGLASSQITRLKLEGKFDSDALSRIATLEGVRVAIVYRDSLGSTLPPRWVYVGSWRLPEPYMVGGDTVTFYSPDDSDSQRLRDALRGYSPCLPETIEQSGYMEQKGNMCVAAHVPTGWIW